MKRFLRILTVVGSLLFPTFVFAAASVTTCSMTAISETKDLTGTFERGGSTKDLGNVVDLYTCSFTANTTNAGYSETTLTLLHPGFIMQLETNPGSTAPSDNYSLTIATASGGTDILGTAMIDLDTANTEYWVPYIDTAKSARGEVYVSDPTLTIGLYENAVNSADTALRIWVRRLLK